MQYSRRAQQVFERMASRWEEGWLLRSLEERDFPRLLELYQSNPFYNGVALEEPYIKEPMARPWYGGLTSVEVPEGSIFVMGDNRNNSNDSRDATLGTVDVRYVLGKAELVFFPPRSFGLIR